MKIINSSYFVPVLGVIIMSCHYFGEMRLLEFFIWSYCIVAAFLLGTLIPIINVSFNEQFMITIVMPLIFAKADRAAVEKMVNDRSLHVPVVWNIACLVYFCIQMRDIYLVMAAILILVYGRVLNLIMRESIVRHLVYLDRLN